MTEKEYHKHFIKAIKEKLPPNILLVNYISKMINVGTEAAYRRIRGVVDFSFNEVITIIEDLDIPLSHLSNNRFEYIPFTPYLIKNNPNEEYRNNLGRVINDFKSILKDGDANVYFCYDSIPPELMFRYPSIMKIRWAKYIIQNEAKERIMIEDIEIPSYIQKTFDDFEDIVKDFEITLIIGEHFLQASFEEIIYFASLKLLSKEFLHKLENDLTHFINELETFALTGNNIIGKRFEIYLYHVYSTGSIVLAQGQKKNIAYLKTFGTNYFSSEDPIIYEAQINWIQNMKRNSTYITQSGEVVRSKFFRHQRALLKKCIEDSLTFIS